MSVGAFYHLISKWNIINILKNFLSIYGYMKPQEGVIEMR